MFESARPASAGIELSGLASALFAHRVSLKANGMRSAHRCRDPSEDYGPNGLPRGPSARRDSPHPRQIV